MASSVANGAPGRNEDSLQATEGQLRPGQDEKRPTMQRMRLVDLADDIFSIIAPELSAEDVYRLYLTCPGLQKRMVRAVTHFSYRFAENQCLAQSLATWPSFVYNLLSLTTLEIVYPEETFWAYFDDIPELERLYNLKSLTSLSLRLPGFGWLEKRLGVPGHASLKGIFPRLLRLTLEGVPPTGISWASQTPPLTLMPSHWRAFPSTLEHLTLYSMVVQEMPRLDVLLPRLQSLQFKLSAPDWHRDWTLPETLTALNISQKDPEETGRPLKLSYIGKDLNGFRHALPNLKELQEVYFAPSTASSAWHDLKNFPNGESLKVQLFSPQKALEPGETQILQRFVDDFPKSLTKLELGHAHNIDISVLMRLPQTITDLKFNGNLVVPGQEEQFLLHLPRNLCSLRCHLSSDSLCSWIRTSPGRLSVLPSTLTSCDLVDRFFPHCYAAELFPALTELNCHLIVSPTSFPPFPSRLTSLQLRLIGISSRVSPTSPFPPLQHLSSFAEALRNATTLRKAKIHLVTPPVLVQGRYIPGGPSASPVTRDSRGTEWYWLQETLEQEPFLWQENPVLRLDLLFPPSLEDLELWINCSLLGSDCDTDSKLTVLFEDDPQETLVNTPNSSTTRQDYFHNLKQVQISTNYGTNVEKPVAGLIGGRRKWPRTIRRLHIDGPGHSFGDGSLHELLRVIHPNLTELFVYASKLDRDQIRQLPQTLQKLSISNVQYAKGPPAKVSWLDLPRQLQELAIVHSLIAFEDVPASPEAFARLVPPSLKIIPNYAQAGYTEFEKLGKWLTSRRYRQPSPVRLEYPTTLSKLVGDCVIS